MKKLIIKFEKTEKGINAEIDGEHNDLVNMLANLIIDEPRTAALFADSTMAALSELSRRDKNKNNKKESKIIKLS